ncbi:hypothetical protein HNY73_005251 [Argiope bruennichi]|uniref:Uncharacterized protein n=1 Tax=Argiope bruennichi TaxID=94029 RepID=A0A8T0FLC9_ARGBR|nr:hypothetical protein HNY73_005251 [Argiope bruennichi]
MSSVTRESNAQIQDAPEGMLGLLLTLSKLSMEERRNDGQTRSMQKGTDNGSQLSEESQREQTSATSSEGSREPIPESSTTQRRRNFSSLPGNIHPSIGRISIQCLRMHARTIEQNEQGSQTGSSIKMNE